MSQSGLTAEPRVAWPSNGISEVPFRLYTDPDAVPARAGADLQGPDLELSLPRRSRLANPGDYVATTIGETAVIVARDAAGAINAFVNRCAHRGNLLCLERARQRQGDHLHLSRLDLRPRRPADRRRVRARRQAPGRHAAGIPQGRAPSAAAARRRIRRPGVRHVQRRDTRSRNLSRPRRHARPAARAEPARPHLLGRSTQVMPNNWKLYFENVKDTYHASILHSVPDDVPDQPAAACRAASTSTTAAAIISATPSSTTRPRTPTTRRRQLRADSEFQLAGQLGRRIGRRIRRRRLGADPDRVSRAWCCSRCATRSRCG